MTKPAPLDEAIRAAYNHGYALIDSRNYAELARTKLPEQSGEAGELIDRFIHLLNVAIDLTNEEIARLKAAARHAWEQAQS